MKPISLCIVDIFPESPGTLSVVSSVIDTVRDRSMIAIPIAERLDGGAAN